MDRRLRINYTTDLHGFFSAEDYATGKRGASGLIHCMQAFARGENVLTLDGGDTIHGSPFTACLPALGYSPGETAAALMNIGGYAAVTLGNHDFSFGRKELEKYIAALEAKCLCANVRGVKGVLPYSLFPLANGLTVGVCGITTDYLPRIEKPENLQGVTFTDAFTAAEAALEELKKAGADITVCLYHGGFETDPDTGRMLSDTGEDIACRLCSGLSYDIVLTGHRHMNISGKTVQNSFAAQTEDKGKCFLLLEGSFSDTGKKSFSAQLLPPSGTGCPAAERFLAPIEAAVDCMLDTPVGSLDREIPALQHLEAALHGSPLANFFNRVQLDYTGADISCAALSNTPAGLPEAVSMRNILSAYPYPNVLKVLLVSKATVKAALERCAEYFTLTPAGKITLSEAFLSPPQHFNFDYFYGIRAVLDISRPCGDRIRSIRYRGREWEDGKPLKLCLNDYRAAGAGGYAMYCGCAVLFDGREEISSLLTDYLRSHPSVLVDTAHYLTLLT